MRTRGTGWTALALVIALAPALAFGQTKEKSLYERLGGKTAIAAVVDEFVSRVAADGRINSFFAATAADPRRLAHFKSLLVDQICEASGGPCKYAGKDMKSAHRGMGISGAHFDALVGDLRRARHLQGGRTREGSAARRARPDEGRHRREEVERGPS